MTFFLKGRKPPPSIVTEEAKAPLPPTRAKAPPLPYGDTQGQKGQVQPPPLAMAFGQKALTRPTEVNAPATPEKDISTLQVKSVVCYSVVEAFHHFVSIQSLPTNDQAEVARERAENHRLVERIQQLMEEKQQHINPVLETLDDPPPSTMRGSITGVVSSTLKKEMTGIAFTMFLVD